MKVHVGSISLRKPWAISLTQGADAGFPALVTNFTALITATVIKTHPGTSFSHWFAPLLSKLEQMNAAPGHKVDRAVVALAHGVFEASLWLDGRSVYQTPMSAWIKSGYFPRQLRCPLSPQKRTFVSAKRMSAMGQ